jgi:hypothetical protein
MFLVQQVQLDRQGPLACQVHLPLWDQLVLLVLQALLDKQDLQVQLVQVLLVQAGT